MEQAKISEIKSYWATIDGMRTIEKEYESADRPTTIETTLMRTTD